MPHRAWAKPMARSGRIEGQPFGQKRDLRVAANLLARCENRGFEADSSSATRPASQKGGQIRCRSCLPWQRAGPRDAPRLRAFSPHSFEKWPKNLRKALDISGDSDQVTSHMTTRAKPTPKQGSRGTPKTRRMQRYIADHISWSFRCGPL